MFSNFEKESTTDKIAGQNDKAESNNLSFASVMSADSTQSPWVSRASATLPIDFHNTLTPGTFDQPQFMNPTMPAMQTVPYWQQPQDTGSLNRGFQTPGANPGWLSPTPPAPASDYRNSGPIDTNSGHLDGPGSGNPWNSSWGDHTPGGQFNPAPPPVDSGKPWRAGYGDVAPGFPRNPAQPDPDSYKPWRNNWGDVAPGVPRPSQPDTSYNPGNDTSSNSSPVNSRPSPWGEPSDTPPTSSGNSHTDSPGGMQNPGDFFPGYPGGPSDNTGGQPRPGDSSAGNGNAGVTSDQAKQALDQDQVTRTQYTFEDSVSKFKQLGKENEVSLEVIMRDWLQQQNQKSPIAFMRGTAAIADGLGQFRLEEGSRIDQTSHQDTKPRILKGCDYDFGGEATTFLRLSAGSLVEAQQYVNGHKGMVVDGQPLDDAYLSQLRNLQTGVESELNVVYGQHDIDAVYNVLRNEVRVHAGDWQKGLVRMQHTLDALRSTDHRFISKSARDVALGYLAEADYMSTQNNGEDAKVMYRDANKYLGLSMQQDPNAPDNRAIQLISSRLGSQINKAIDNQWKDPLSNPFEIPMPNGSYV